MKTSDIQQAISGFNTTAVIPGPYTVRVHEALDVVLTGQKYRYFISVDFKFRESDALNIGKLGWYGVSKSEATKEATALAAKLTLQSRIVNSSKENALNWDTLNNRITAQRQEATLAKLVGKYCAEFC